MIESSLLQEGFKEAQTEFAEASSAEEAQQQINKFRDLVNRNQVQGNERNIDYWRKQGWEKFNEFVSTKSQQKSSTQIKRSKTPGKSVTVHEDNNWLVVVPLDKDASCFHGKNTDWCTTKPNERFFEQYFYDDEITLIYFLHLGTGDKWAIAVENQDIDMFDKNDNRINEQQFQQQTGFNPIEYRDKVIGSSDIQQQSAQSRQLYREAVDRIQLAYPFRQVNAQLEADLLFVKNTSWIVIYCANVKGRWPQVEKMIASTMDVIQYVKDVLHSQRLPEIESKIRSPEIAVTYARRIIEGRWEEGERVIMQSPLYSYIYAFHVLRRRWPEAEPIIASDKYASEEYCEKFGIDISQLAT